MSDPCTCSWGAPHGDPCPRDEDVHDCDGALQHIALGYLARAERAEAELARQVAARVAVDAAENEECARLRAALRSAAIRIEPYDRDRDTRTWVGCHTCASAWPEGEPEDHRDGCLAEP